MAVTQYFTIDVPEGVSITADPGSADAPHGTTTLTMSRADAETLCADLGEALHPEGVASPQEGIQEALADVMAALMAQQNEVYEPDAPTGRQMTPDEALARAQAQSMVQPAAPVRNPGTGIGNG